MFKTITTAVCSLAAAATLSAQTPAKPATSAKMTMPAPTAQATVATTAKPIKAHRESRAALRKEAKISMSAARATALKEVPNGKVSSAELERENGKLLYSFDIKLAGKSGVEEVQVDALTGAVLSKEHESPKTEAKEVKKEKK